LSANSNGEKVKERNMPAHQNTHENARPAKIEKTRKAEKISRGQVNAEQMLEAPETLRSGDVLAAQQQVGNRVVQRVLDKTQLRDFVTDDQGDLIPEISDEIQQKRGGGNPLPENIQNEVGETLGHNFDDVRVHTDESADKLSQTINARAFTVGSDIFFKGGVFAPGTTAGRETLIHELTHVVQQSGGKTSGGALKLGAPDSVHEEEAASMGKKHSSGAMSAASGANGVVQKQAEEDELQMQPDEDELQMEPDDDELGLKRLFDEKPEVKDEDEDMGLAKLFEEKPEAKDEDEDMGLAKLFEEKPEAEDEDMGLGKLFEEKPEAEDEDMGLNKLFEEKPEEDEEDMGLGKLFEEKPEEDDEDMGLGKLFEEKPEAKDEDDEDMGLAKLFEEQEEGGTQTGTEEKKESPNSRENLMAIIRDPNSDPEQVEAAQKKLDLLHKRGKFSSLKSMLSRNSTSGSYSAEAMGERKKALEEAARNGDEEALKKLELMNKNPQGSSLSGSIWGGIKKGLGMGASFLGQGFKDYMSAGKDSDEEDGDSESESEGKGGAKSSGGSAAGTIMEKYAEVVEENKKLKGQLKKLNVPVPEAEAEEKPEEEAEEAEKEIEEEEKEKV
jgi:hypothetical protein